MFACAISSGSPWRTLCALLSRTTASPTNTICAVPARPPSEQIAYCLLIRSAAARGMRIDLIWVSRNGDIAGLSQQPAGRKRRHGIGLNAARCCEMDDDEALCHVTKASSCMSLVVYFKQPLCALRLRSNVPTPADTLRLLMLRQLGLCFTDSELCHNGCCAATRMSCAS